MRVRSICMEVTINRIIIYGITLVALVGISLSKMIHKQLHKRRERERGHKDMIIHKNGNILLLEITM